MLWFIRIRKYYRPIREIISKHHMLWFIYISKWRINTWNRISKHHMLWFIVTLQSFVMVCIHFKTSYVMVYQRRSHFAGIRTAISKHHMLWFIPRICALLISYILLLYPKNRHFSIFYQVSASFSISTTTSPSFPVFIISLSLSP